MQAILFKSDIPRVFFTVSQQLESTLLQHKGTYSIYYHGTGMLISPMAQVITTAPNSIASNNN